MLISMNVNATEEQMQAVCKRIEELGFRPHPLTGTTRYVIGITGNKDLSAADQLSQMPGVAEVIAVSKPYKLVSRDMKPEDTLVRFAGSDATVGGAELAIMAGPCSVESRDQIFRVAEAVAKGGARFLRGGAFKPRTSPYAFQGMGERGLEIMAAAREAFGLLVVTEAIDQESLALVDQYADMIQIGARNMQNFALLKQAGRATKPVLLKRGMSATLDELLMAAEYIMSEGNYNVVLCERGMRTFAAHTRNTLDVGIIPSVKKLTHLPIIVDPSHAAGERDKVVPLARAGVAAGADGLIVEVHCDPDHALSDGAQSLYPDQFAAMVGQLRSIGQVLGRTIQQPRKPQPSGAGVEK
jgi:3-deoxy-7-phosphoheptulonate synthase